MTITSAGAEITIKRQDDFEIVYAISIPASEQLLTDLINHKDRECKYRAGKTAKKMLRDALQAGFGVDGDTVLPKIYDSFDTIKSGNPMLVGFAVVDSEAA